MNPLLPQLDPQTFQVLLEEIGIRYTETEPTHIPNKRVEAWVYFDGADYWLYLWANGGWRSQQLGAGGGTPAGSDTQVQFNDGGAFGADAGLTYNKTTDVLSVKEIDAPSGQDITVVAPNGATATSAGKRVLLFAGEGGATSGSGGSVELYAGDANGANANGGFLFVDAGDGRGTGTGGFATIQAGDANGSGAAGDATVIGGSGSGTSSRGGDAYLQGGNTSATNARGGHAFVQGGSGHGSGNGGDVTVVAGSKGSSGQPGQVSLSNGIGPWLMSGMDTMTYAATISLSVNANTLHKTTTVHATGNATINASGVGNAGQVLIIIITNDATSGKVITFGTNFLSTGTLTGTASKSAVIGFVSDGSSWYEMYRTLAL